MSDRTDETNRIARLARRMSDDARIATPSLVHLLKTIDAEIAQMKATGEGVPASVRELRAIAALACVERREGVPAGGTRTSR